MTPKFLSNVEFWAQDRASEAYSHTFVAGARRRVASQGPVSAS